MRAEYKGDTMQYIGEYHSPMGIMYMVCDEVGLCGLWFEGQKYFQATMDKNAKQEECELMKPVRAWLDVYFAGGIPGVLPPLHLSGSSFRMDVWEELLKIPYGETTTYGELAKRIAEKRGIARMSAQAVGGAVGHNPVSVIVPCHRVVGTDGSLTGYAGGIHLKEQLLLIEKKGKGEQNL